MRYNTMKKEEIIKVDKEGKIIAVSGKGIAKDFKKKEEIRYLRFYEGNEMYPFFTIKCLDKDSENIKKMNEVNNIKVEIITEKEYLEELDDVKR
jgi:hypothetical protein